MKTYNIPIVIEYDKDGYVASCPTLQGCYTQGETYEEALENIKDAIRLHLEDRQETDEELQATTVSLTNVAVQI